MADSNPTYFDGRGMEKVAQEFMKQQWYQDRVKAIELQKDGKNIIQRYPHPMELGY